jgi:thiosulfate dehydrogenase (quinone) large subunit
MQAAYSRNATAIALLRIFVGIFFLVFGQYKVFGTAFTLHGGFEDSIRGFLAQGTYPHGMYPGMAPILRNVVLPHARVCAFLTGYGEFLIG